VKKATAIYESASHSWYVIARDPQRPGCVIDTNEYLITAAGQALITDPGGMEIFPAVFQAVGQVIDPAQVRVLFASHQDPDVISSLALWLEFQPQARCYVSALWKTFIPHFGGDEQTLMAIPDAGMDIPLGPLMLRAVPAHYLHSSGNFHLYDPQARILFSGDIGAALLPHDQQGLFVEDFDSHIRHAEGFHRRWMGSNSAKRDWCERVSRLDIDLLCPQHGAIYRGEDVMRFINWLDELKVGIV